MKDALPHRVSGAAGRGTTKEKELNLATVVPRYSKTVEWQPAMLLMSQAELATMRIEPPDVMPHVTNTATEVGAAVRLLADRGWLSRMGAWDIARALCAPYAGRSGTNGRGLSGLSMIATADAADTITAWVTTPALVGAAWQLRRLRLRDRLAEFGLDAEQRYYEQIALRRDSALTPA